MSTAPPSEQHHHAPHVRRPAPRAGHAPNRADQRVLPAVPELRRLLVRPRELEARAPVLRSRLAHGLRGRADRVLRALDLEEERVADGQRARDLARTVDSRHH